MRRLYKWIKEEKGINIKILFYKIYKHKMYILKIVFETQIIDRIGI